ncbi:MAG: lysine--tRNA ligase [Candidatus Ryanbacteria bacterium RIFCSPHIGHO2_02_FULL_45_17b]|uniref:Lysine--tRNA ligase n=1 Tax=Candidatus Ryanbacteria bacterium RIFCSPHIGHO2_01_FULL_45_22 TaxID=1802114 RepID=A0A1G2G0M1_9BACT|nr:MAG: lysine--tRNA ligase [Candidatus Ryanbacteria bacterium RIFCSPHIGHO2_01_FULL_45_22]OGZ46998.1 MAG: lysine--tRNA ligase [Candidatus Ryanbacteria bacterium RIFCSPHIGHO2_02_FULL_45_17b]
MLEEIRRIRLHKIELLRENGMDPYPSDPKRTHTIHNAHADFLSLEHSGQPISIVGRVRAMRSHGGSTFLDIEDGTGTLQGYLKEDILGKDSYDFFNSVVDVGDIIEVSGTLFATKKEEETLKAAEWRMLAKSLLPLPEKWHGLEDVEERLRRRYLDLIMDQNARDLFVKKSLFWQETRTFLIREGGLEVETPVLERIPGGADAEPFKTHLNALDIDLYLRIAPELNLKRLIVGGYDKIFEIGRIFRNEGIDREHLQDYTQMEMYWSYTDYKQLMQIVERLVTCVIEKTLGGLTHAYQDRMIDWSLPWKQIDYYDVFHEYTGLHLAGVSEEELKTYARNNSIDTQKHAGRGRLIDIIFKKKVRPNLWEPGFLVLPPVDIEPLAKRWSEDTGRVERFQIVAGGSELGKGFSELNDPFDQRERFREQAQLGKAGDTEAQRMDEDFVEALEYGMPPTAGFAYSERLFAFLLDRPIRETVFFPLMRPK